MADTPLDARNSARQTDLPPLLHVYFEEQARRTPDRIALREGDTTSTYAELQARVDRIGRALQDRGIGVGDLVGLHMDRSISWAAAVLGVLTAHAAVVPLPPSFPARRIREIVEFGDLRMVIDHAEQPGDPSVGDRWVRLDDLEEGPDAENRAPARAEITPDRPAFVLSSSGSTGHPKLIVRSHRSFFHRLNWTWTRHPFGPDDVGCQKAHMTTTHALYELFEPLLAGAPAIIVKDQDARNLERFWAILRARSVTRLLIVPSALQASLDMPGFDAPPLDVVVLMGEYVPPTLAARAVAALPQQTSLYSIYGSTEASSTLVVDLRSSARAGEKLPLGVPISHDVEALVLDDHGESVAPGEVGRLYMAGSPLFSGYLNDPGATEAVFRELPGRRQRLYDTRDRVRMTADGNLHFVGRVDHTVKIRGFRVDLPEVEEAIRECPGVRQAAVVVSGANTAGATLIGFFLPGTADPADIYAAIKGRLPEYMVPSELVGLDEVPLTASAKVDRVRLLAEHTARNQPAFDRPLSAAERQVADAWERTLGHRRFGLESSFFEVGGTSLTTFSMVHRLREICGPHGEVLTEESVYRFPSVAAMAAHIEGIQNGRPAQDRVPAPILVTLRQAKGLGAERSPLFVIASAGGTLGAYQKLAATLATDRAVLGLRDPFLWGGREATEGFQAWVGRYLDAIRERQPRGPYYLCAYSSAGAFGYEMAKRLREQGEEVALLALVDPLGMDRMGRDRYGYWAMESIWLRRQLRPLVRLGGSIHALAVRLRRAAGRESTLNDYTLSDEEYREIARSATGSPDHIRTLAALLELNSGLPVAFAEDDVVGLGAEEYLSALQDRLLQVMPDVDPATIERLAAQYSIQVRTQQAYRLTHYRGRVLLVQPRTHYAGFVEAQLRPYLTELTACVVPVGLGERRPAVAAALGRLETHYRSMRDDTFVDGLARKLNGLLA